MIRFGHQFSVFGFQIKVSQSSVSPSWTEKQKTDKLLSDN